jgi:cell division protein FtsB
MERKGKEKVFRKIFNRSLSYVVLLGSIFLLSFSVAEIIKYKNALDENKNLSSVLASIEEENERLELLNSKLSDDSYLSFYVKNGYQYDGNKVIEINVND